MSIDVTTEKRFESDIEEFFLSPEGGYTHNQDVYDPQLGVYQDTLLRFIQKTQPKEWKRFLLQNKVDPERKFCLAFNNACDMDGLISVLRHGFKHRGIPFKVCYFKPESGLNQTAMSLYEKNEITCNRQWFYSNDTHNSVEKVGIKNTITNFFAYNTKREIVGQVKDTDAFKSCYADTISCSHPCLARYNKKGSKEYPVNCGYCYPCLIRKSSLLDIDEIKKYSYQGEAYDFLIEYEESEKSADLRAVLGSIYRCKHSSDKELKRYIRCVGELTEEEVEKFLSLYKKSIEDLVQLFSADQRMKEYLGL